MSSGIVAVRLAVLTYMKSTLRALASRASP